MHSQQPGTPSLPLLLGWRLCRRLLRRSLRPSLGSALGRRLGSDLLCPNLLPCRRFRSSCWLFSLLFSSLPLPPPPLKRVFCGLFFKLHLSSQPSQGQPSS